jgi:GDSL-like lipase/acylhydrolase family protein
MDRARTRRHVSLLLAAMILTACDQYAVAARSGPTPSPDPVLTPAPSEPDPCVVHGLAPGSAGDVFRDPVGGCIPTELAVLLRCDPGGPPTIVLNAGTTPRAFLGGSYAVRMPYAPRDPVAVGVSTSGRVWRSAEDPNRLYLESAGHWERWLVVPNADHVSTVPAAWMIGDSILDGGATDVVEALPTWDVTIDAEVGRGSSTAADIAEAGVDPRPDVVVIEIGTNDHDPDVVAANLARILTATRDADLVVFDTIHSPATDSRAINDAIVAAASRAPQATIADWDGFVGQDALSSDGIHPEAGHEDLMAKLLTPILEGWLDAVHGGATGCWADPGAPAA